MCEIVSPRLTIPALPSTIGCYFSLEDIAERIEFMAAQYRKASINSTEAKVFLTTK